MAPCKVCGRSAIGEWLDLGLQALTNRFLVQPHEDEFAHPCKLGVCRVCATVQLESAVPVEEMRPRFDWIAYNEPEKHLDDLAEVLIRLPGLTPASRIGGMTYKDDTTLQRLNRLGFQSTWRAEMSADLGIVSPLAGIETVQAAMTVPAARRLAGRHGRPDVLLIRHVLEHSYDIHEVLRFARELAAPHGYIVFEIPDARRALERLDYSTIWEEHLFYFTPTTLRRLFALSGFDVLFLESYHYTLENSLIAIVRPAASLFPIPTDAQASVEELARADRFIHEFPRVRDDFQRRLRSFAARYGQIAMLGAGHLSGAFINFYGLEDVVGFVADDNVKKQGLYMPGSRLPIVPSCELLSRGARLCLMSVRPEIEDAVIAKNQVFLNRGGMLASVFPESRYAFEKLAGVAV